MNKRICLLACFLMAGCASPEELEARRIEQQHADHQACLGYGFHPKTDGYRNCLMELDIARQQRAVRYYDPYPRIHYGFGYHHFR